MGISQSSQAVYFNISPSALLIFFFPAAQALFSLLYFKPVTPCPVCSSSEKSPSRQFFCSWRLSLLPLLSSPLDLNKLSPFNLASLPPCLTEPAGCSRLQTVFPADIVTQGHEKLVTVQKEGEVEAGAVILCFRRRTSSEKINCTPKPAHTASQEGIFSFFLALFVLVIGLFYS